MTARQQLQPTEIELGLRMWLQLFEKCIRERDYETAKTLFHQNVFAYGTDCVLAENLDQLVENEWKPAWSSQIRFTFEMETNRVVLMPDAFLVGIQWNAEPVLLSNGLVGRKVGRATFLLRSMSRKLLCVHSHFSASP